MGDDPGEVYPPAAGRELKRLNTNSYRITAEDRLGEGSPNRSVGTTLRRSSWFGSWMPKAARRPTKRSARSSNTSAGAAFRRSSHGTQRRIGKGSARSSTALLTPEEYEAARASTLNAHYTSAIVINGIYEAVQRLGFSHGRILEPAAGIGHFFGLMPKETSARSRLTAIELDPLTASIARKLYPDADIRAQGFEAAALVDGSFDLAICNVPFGDYKAFDPQFNDRNFFIHDYFFPKGIEKVRSGGLIVFITSKGTFEKVNSGLRDYLYDKADFLGAIRLPNTAFKQNANTEVTTDIVFLRKLADGEKPSGPPWLKLAEHTNGDGVTFQINEYFAANSHMMLGTMANAETM
jgi:predicted O-methyltransferase YrrM